jgi:hypothetical protein
MGPFLIEFSTRSNDVVKALKSRSDADVSVERNMTGETIVLLSVLAPIATVAIKEIGKMVHERQLSLRSQKLKLGKGTLSFDGFSSDEICEVLEKLQKSDRA